MLKVLNTVSEGGQTWAHRMRMLRQVAKIIISLSLLLSFLGILFQLFFHNYSLLISSWYFIKAEILYFTGFQKISVDTTSWYHLTGQKYGGKDIVLSIGRVLNATTPKVNLILTKGMNSLNFGIKIFMISSLSLFSYFLFRGSQTKKRKHIAGKKIIHDKVLTIWLKLTGRASEIKIDTLPLVKGTETTHVLVTGGTGSGKTNCLHHLLKNIRKSKAKAIVVDTTGGFIERYYREGKDIIMNPLDNRGVEWSPWSECHTKFDYEDLSESLIPISHHENEAYWRTAARALLSAVMQKLEMTKRTSDLVKWILYESLPNLCDFVEGTKAASHFDKASEKTSSSVRSVASSFTDCLEHLQDSEDPFSIRKWVGEEDDSWLFLSCKPSERTSIAPLLSTWMSTAVKGVLELKPSRTRRLWFVLDELPTLNKVKRLETLLTEGRKYGACAMIALQSPSQLVEIYGREASKVITGNCATKIVFAEYDAETAERISRVFGEKETGEFQEGISYGANDIRDGVNLSYQKKRERTVTATDIQELIPNQAYIKLPGRLPITRLKLKIAKS